MRASLFVPPPFPLPLWGEGLCPIDRPMDGHRTNGVGFPGLSMLLVVLLTADAPEVCFHGLCAGSGVFLRKEGFLVCNDLAQVDLACPNHRCYRGETLACLQLLRARLGAALAMNGRLFQSGGFHVVVNGAKFLRDLARDMVNRVFKYYFSHFS